MNLVDANVLLYAVNEADPRHDESRSWLDGALNAGEPVGFAWVVLLAFLRLSTKLGLFPQPLDVDTAATVIREWLDQPSGVVVEPTSRHAGVLLAMLREIGAAGNLVTDAHLAALAVEHDAQIVSYDQDFRRFQGVRCVPPAAPSERG